MSTRVPSILQVRPNLVLRAVTAADAPVMFAVVDANRGHLRRWLPWLDANRHESDSRGFLEHCEKSAAAGSDAVMAVEESGRFCGVAGFNRIDPVNRIGTIGYWLAESHQGRGIMTASVARIVRTAFEDLNLNRLSINAAVENHRSRAIPQRLGFKIEGTVRQVEWLYDHYVDHVVYALLREEWAAASIGDAGGDRANWDRSPPGDSRDRSPPAAD